jgi:hypothetical protein
MLMGAAVIFSTIASVPSFAASEETKWINVQDLYKQCDARQGSFDEIFLFGICFGRSTSAGYQSAGVERH